MSSKELYQYNDRLLFRVKHNGNISFDETIEDRTISFVCPEHRIDLVEEKFLLPGTRGFRLSCPLCEQKEGYKPIRFDGIDFGILEKKRNELDLGFRHSGFILKFLFFCSNEKNIFKLCFINRSYCCFRISVLGDFYWYTVIGDIK